jgi:histidinol-phosphate aminotransferase
MSCSYQPPGFDHPIDLDLSRNEGAPRISAVAFDPERVAALTARYPDTGSLRQAIADRHGVGAEQVLVTAGGDDALLRCFMSVAGETVVATKPSFEMIGRYAAQVGAPLIEVPWWDGDFPLADFLDEAARGGAEMAVVVSPNNPTGNVIGPGELRKVAEAYPLLVLDAAYTEFADVDLTHVALEMENVVLVRTLSKAWGLAGLRVGYLLGPPALISRIAGYGSPYAVSGLSAALAEEAVRVTAPAAGAVVANRAGLSMLLSELGCRPLPSQANFVLATSVDPPWLVAAAASLGIGLRRFDSDDLAGCVRITVPSEEPAMERLGATLSAALAPEALLFDLDGVLVDVSLSYQTAIVETAAAFGVEVTPAQISEAKAVGGSSDDWELTRVLCAAAGVDVALDVVTAEFERRYQGEGGNGLKRRETLLADRETLGRWSERLPLAVVTARPRKDAEEVLRRFGVADLFTTVVSREDAAAKPDPAPVRLALERLGARSAWMVGDTPDDLAAARGAGVVPIAVAGPGVDPRALTAAARVLDAVGDLEEVLDAIR